MVALPQPIGRVPFASARVQAAFEPSGRGPALPASKEKARQSPSYEKRSIIIHSLASKNSPLLAVMGIERQSATGVLEQDSTGGCNLSSELVVVRTDVDVLIDKIAGSVAIVLCAVATECQSSRVAIEIDTYAVLMLISG